MVQGVKLYNTWTVGMAYLIRVSFVIAYRFLLGSCQEEICMLSTHHLRAFPNKILYMLPSLQSFNLLLVHLIVIVGLLYIKACVNRVQETHSVSKKG